MCKANITFTIVVIITQINLITEVNYDNIIVLHLYEYIYT